MVRVELGEDYKGKRRLEIVSDLEDGENTVKNTLSLKEDISRFKKGMR